MYGTGECLGQTAIKQHLEEGRWMVTASYNKHQQRKAEPRSVVKLHLFTVVANKDGELITASAPRATAGFVRDRSAMNRTYPCSAERRTTHSD